MVMDFVWLSEKNSDNLLKQFLSDWFLYCWWVSLLCGINEV